MFFLTNTAGTDPGFQYNPKGIDFSTITDTSHQKIQHRISRRPRKKLIFDSPKNVFFRPITDFAVAG